jgi:trans-2,3-dihydro-3-hydroxyanthranilate isomerase
MEFYQLDVFAGGAYRGNPLAAFPDASGLSADQMQTIAREMNLSETSFVQRVSADSYDVRIFTPAEELPFAGHPTIGAAWLLRELGLVTADQVTQRSGAGDTIVTHRGEQTWLERSGASEPDLDETRLGVAEDFARALGLEPNEIGLEAREFGRPGRLMPGYANSGLRQLMVPLRDLDALGRAWPLTDLSELDPMGTYCFTAATAGGLRARGFFPGVGVPEDPATGSAAATLGIYLAARLGDIRLQVTQGVEMGRPSVIELQASDGHVEIGGSCHLIFKGELQALP